jgi:hypothetical protein
MGIPKIAKKRQLFFCAAVQLRCSGTWTAAFLGEKRIFVLSAKLGPPLKFRGDSKSAIRFQFAKILCGYMRSTRADFIYPMGISAEFR